jgi:hypothetical protein
LSKRDQWRKTIEEQLPIRDSERQSVRRIMSRLRGNADDPEQDTPLTARPVQNLDRSSNDTSLDIVPVQNLDQPETIKVSAIDSSPATPVQKLDRSEIYTPLEIEPVKKSDQSQNKAGQTVRPVKPVTVTENRPVKELDRSNEKRGGYLKLPNEILDSTMPRLSPAEQVVFLRLYRLSAGFGSNRCTVGNTALTQACNISEQTCRTTIRRLIDMELIRLVEVVNTREIKGSTYEILAGMEIRPVQNLDRSESGTGLKTMAIKDHDHEDLKKHDHHQSAHEREMMTLYQSITGNKWNKADQAAYEKIKDVAIETVAATMKAVNTRAAQKPGSLAYFIKEILAAANPTPATRKAYRAQLQPIIERVRASYAGGHYEFADLEDRVRAICEREGIVFDKLIFNEIVS